MIVGADLRVALHHHGDTVADESAQGHVLRQTHVLDGLAGDLRVGFGHELGYVGTGEGEALDVGHVGVEEELVDVPRGDELLIDYRANVHLGGQGDVVKVLHLCDGLEDAVTLGCQTGQDVRARDFGQGHEGLCVVDALLHKQVGVAPITVDDEHVLGHLCGDLCTLVAVGLDDGDVNVPLPIPQVIHSLNQLALTKAPLFFHCLIYLKEL